MTLWKADCYDANSRLQQTIAENFLTLLKKQFHSIPLNANFLDVGCGAGRTTQSILKSFPGIRVLGIDASKEMIDFANRNFADDKLAFIVDRAEELKMIEKNSIDAITSFSCLHWVHDQPAAFQAMHRVLKQNGWIGLMFAAETGFDDPIDRAYAQAIHEEPWKTYFQKSLNETDWNIAEQKIVKAQLEKIGFEIIFMSTLNFDYPFKDPEAFQNWVLACFQQLKSLPQDLQPGCAQRIVELYLQATADKGPQCVYHVDGFMLMAKKLY